ncbi:S-layer homology domain-containing protein [Chryseomicrobium palamuruense]|uniref:S-layer homology domain-containing protein n=1 Tax=Chryseomicrobium palamuruense TaxID=682973 RepID=A0ABV8UUF4_9BACL
MAYQPKSYKKFVATAATATLVATAVAPTALADFTDVNANYKNAVTYLVDQGITKGLTETTFGVTSPIKRGDAAIMIATALGLNTTTAPDAGFTDVNARVAGAVNAIVAAGIASGKTSTTFAPDLYITRQETAKIIANAYGLTGSGTTKFADVNSNWAPFVSALEQAGIAQGLNETTFGATNDVTRGQFALFLYRAEGQPYEVAAVESLTFNAEGNQFVLKFAEALPEGADLNYVLENYSILLNGVAPTAAQLEALKLSATVSADLTTVTVSHTDLDDLASTLGGTSATLSVGGKAATYVFEVDAKVTSASMLSATVVEVKFNKAVDEDSLFANNTGTFLPNTVSLTSLDNVSPGAITGELSADGKTLWITTSNPISKRYDLEVKNLETTSGMGVTAFKQMYTFAADTTAPVVVSTTKPTAGTVKVTFSEPLSTLGTPNFRLANGTIITGPNGVTYNFNAGDTEVIFTLGSDVPANGQVIATFIGAQDQNRNLISPNPTTVTLQKGAADGVAPTFNSVTQLSATTFAVKFSEELNGTPQITVSNYNVTNIVKDSADTTRYIVTVDGPLRGVQNVNAAGFTDLSGVNGASTTLVANFTIDTVAPRVTSTNVVTDVPTGKQYLEFTFDKNVNLASATVSGSGTYTKDFITTPVTAGPTAVSYKTVGNKTVARVELDAFLGNNDVRDAAYNLNLTFSNVASESAVAVTNPTVTFTRGQDVTPGSTDKVSVSSIAQSQTDNDVVLVTFNRAVDGASATTASNYRIDGATVQSVTLRAPQTLNGATTQVAEVKLAPNSNGFTGVRNINVTGVKALGSTVVMDPYFTNTVSLNENVDPTVVSARLTANNEITVTFSEAIQDGANLDFEVLVGGQSQASPVTVDATPVNGSANTVTLSIPTVTAAQLTSGLSLKALSTLDITDAVGNKPVFTSNVTVTQ